MYDNNTEYYASIQNSLPYEYVWNNSTLLSTAVNGLVLPNLNYL